MKKFLGIFLACAMCISSPFVYSASTRTIPVYLNGKAIDFSSESVKPQLFMGRTYVPLRKICESMGISMEWSPTTKWLTFKRGYTVIEHQVPSNTVYVNGEMKKFDTSSINANGTTLVPIRMLAEAIDANVSWGEKNKTVYITLTGLEITTESTSATIEEPTVSNTTVVSTVPTTTVPTTTAPIAPSIPDAPEK